MHPYTRLTECVTEMYIFSMFSSFCLVTCLYLMLFRNNFRFAYYLHYFVAVYDFVTMYVTDNKHTTTN